MKVIVDAEIFRDIGHKLIVAVSELAAGYDSIATELEQGSMSREDVAKMVREIAHYATDMAKELSL